MFRIRFASGYLICATIIGLAACPAWSRDSTGTQRADAAAALTIHLIEPKLVKPHPGVRPAAKDIVEHEPALPRSMSIVASHAPVLQLTSGKISPPTTVTFEHRPVRKNKSGNNSNSTVMAVPNYNLAIANINAVPFSPDNGWETNAANSGKDIFFTTNFDDTFSVNSAQSVSYDVNPYSFMSDIPNGFCCDQVVQYIPSVNLFVWLAQGSVDSAGENEYRLFVATPAQLESSKGQSWTAYDLKSHDIVGSGVWFDYPEISFDQNYLFLSCDIFPSSAMIARIPLSALTGKAPLPVEDKIVSGWFVRPVQNTTGRGLFVEQAYTNSSATAITLNIYSWPDSASASQVTTTQVDQAWPVSGDYATNTSVGINWLAAGTKVSGHIYGATQSGNELFIAWNNGRLHPAGGPNFPYPFVFVAQLDSNSYKPLRTDEIYNTSYAIAYPALATSAAGDVGASIMYGGGAIDPTYAVGLWTTNKAWQLVAASPPGPYGGGGHYLGIRPIANTSCFAAAGYVAIANTANVPFGYGNQAYYVEFAYGSTKANTCP